jgi:hypothetical protein
LHGEETLQLQAILNITAKPLHTLRDLNKLATAAATGEEIPQLRKPNVH